MLNAPIPADASLSSRLAAPAVVQQKAPVGMIATWLLYSLLALGYFGYQEALFGSLCVGLK